MSLLQHLYRLAGLIDDLPSPGFETKTYDFSINVTRSGRVDVVDVRRTSKKAPPVQRRLAVLKRSGTSAPPVLLTDNLQYLAGVPKDDRPASETKALSTRDAYLALLREAAVGIGETVGEQLEAIARALDDREAVYAAFARAGIVLEPSLASSVCNVLYDDEALIDAPELILWWAARSDTGSARGTGICQISGVDGPIAYKFPAVKGLPGNQPTLVSANFAAALRYDAEQGTGARVGVAAAHRINAALNWLLAQDDHHYKIGDTTLIWWTDVNLEENLMSAVVDAHQNPNVVKALIETPWKGKTAAAEVRDFHAAVLTVNTARVVVRSEIETPVGELRASLQRWAAWQVPVDRLLAVDRVNPLRALLRAVARPGAQGAKVDDQTALLNALLELALTGRPVPVRFLGPVLMRCRAEPEHPVTDERAALLSLILRSHRGGAEIPRSPAFLAGAWFAELDGLQYAVTHGKVNRSVTESYFAAAMVNPQRVARVLSIKAQQHLGRLRRDAPGAAVAIVRRLGAVTWELAEFPGQQIVEQQAEFALGFWTTRAERFAAARSDERQPSRPVDVTVRERDENRTAGYACGALLAELEHLQREAPGRVMASSLAGSEEPSSAVGLNHSIIDSHFASAIARPADAFPALLALAQTHLGTVRRSGRPVAAWAIRARIARWCACLSTFPEALSDAEAASFVLGHGHQTAVLDAFAATKDAVPRFGPLGAPPDPTAHALGELFAAREEMQRSVLGDGLNRTLADSFFAGAMTAPRAAERGLRRRYRAHLAKPRLGNPADYAARVAINRRARQLHELAGREPAELTLRQQGDFALGYFHAIAESLDRMEQRQQARSNQSPTTTSKEP